VTKGYGFLDWDKVKQFKQPDPEKGVLQDTPLKPAGRLQKLGQVVPEEELKSAFEDLSGVDVGDSVAVQQPDGAWIYAQVVERSGSSRTGTKGYAMVVQIDKMIVPDASKEGINRYENRKQKILSDDWGKVRQFNPPIEGAGVMGVMQEAVDSRSEDIGKEVPAEELQKAYSDLSGLSARDVVAVQRSDGKWTYARVLKKSGVSFSKTGKGSALVMKVDQEGSTKLVDYADWDKVKQFNEPNPDWGVLSWLPPAAPSSPEPEESQPVEETKLGKEVPEEELQKAFADLAGLRRGDLVAAQQANGKWEYAEVVRMTGSSATGTGEGQALQMNLGNDRTELYGFLDWDKVKQFQQPDLERGVLQDAPMKPAGRLQKLGKTVPEEDLKNAFEDLSGVNVGDSVAVQQPDGAWIYAQVIERSGSSRTGLKGLAMIVQIDKAIPDATKEGINRYENRKQKILSEDWGKVRQFNPPIEGAGVMGVAPEEVKVENENIGEEVPEEDLKKAYADLAGLRRGDLVAVQRSDGKWTYAEVLRRKGTSRSAGSLGGAGPGVAMEVKVDKNGGLKIVDYSDWDKVKQFKPPVPDTGVLSEVRDWKNAPGYVDPREEKVGQECSQEDITNASDDQSDLLNGDVAAFKAPDGKYYYALLKERTGVTAGCIEGSGLTFFMGPNIWPREQQVPVGSGKVKVLQKKGAPEPVAPEPAAAAK